MNSYQQASIQESIDRLWATAKDIVDAKDRKNLEVLRLCAENIAKFEKRKQDILDLESENHDSLS